MVEWCSHYYRMLVGQTSENVAAIAEMAKPGSQMVRHYSVASESPAASEVAVERQQDTSSTDCGRSHSGWQKQFVPEEDSKIRKLVRYFDHGWAGNH